MRDGDIRCYIHHADYANTAELFVIRYGVGEMFFLTTGAEGLCSWREFQEGDKPDPVIRLTGHWGMAVLRDLARAISELGVKLPDEGKTAGLLEAQSAHLADLRRLVPGLAE